MEADDKPYLTKSRLTRISHHRQGCDGLFLDVSRRRRLVSIGIEQFKKTIDKGIKVEYQSVPFYTLTEVD
jgi:hypothetical protein